MQHTSPLPALIVINSGSSSLKFAIYRLDDLLQAQFRGQITAIGESGYFRINNHQGHPIQDQTISVTDHEQALRILLDWLAKQAVSLNIITAGHRVVHGGARFHEPVLITDREFDHDCITFLHYDMPAI